MTRPMLGTALAAALFLTQAGGAAAQNTTEPAPSPPSPAATPTPPPAPTPAPAPPPPASPEPRSDAPPAVVVVPQAQTAPPPIAIESEPYPNGFADPTAPYGNDMSVAVRQESDGFDWGLLGLLGLFGLFGLYRRRDGYRNVVHSERYEDGRPPIRPDR